MSDVMMFGIAKMPYEMAMGDEMSRRQYYSNTQRLAAALEAAPEDGWQPIETALPPMDTPVWLYDGKRTFIGGREVGDGDGCLWWRVLGYVERFNGEDWDIIESESDDLRPTHWQPLPEPPKEASHEV